jgi:hypothetical protein
MFYQRIYLLSIQVFPFFRQQRQHLRAFKKGESQHQQEGQSTSRLPIDVNEQYGHLETKKTASQKKPPNVRFFLNWCMYNSLSDNLNGLDIHLIAGLNADKILARCQSGNIKLEGIITIRSLGSFQMYAPIGIHDFKDDVAAISGF